MAIAIAFLALAFSLATFAHDRFRDKRNLLLALHDRLVTAEQQENRRVVYEMAENGRTVEDLSREEYRQINNALAAFNVLAVHYQRRYVSRADVLDLWGIPIVRTVAAAQPFLEHRSEHVGVPAWRHLRALNSDAEAYIRRHGIPARVPWALDGPADAAPTD